MNLWRRFLLWLSTPPASCCSGNSHAFMYSHSCGGRNFYICPFCGTTRKV